MGLNQIDRTSCAARTGALAAMAAALLAGCAGAPVVEHYTPPPLGTSWTMLQRNTGSFGNGELRSTFTLGPQTWEGRTVVASQSAQGGTLFDPADGRWIALLDGAGKPSIRIEPPIGYTWPMKVGMSSKEGYRWTHLTSGRATSFDNACTVADYGAITVPAGEFKAFRIECANTLGETHVYWFSPELGINIKSSLRRGADSASGAGTRDIELLAQGIRR